MEINSMKLKTWQLTGITMLASMVVVAALFGVYGVLTGEPIPAREILWSAAEEKTVHLTVHHGWNILAVAIFPFSLIPLTRYTKIGSRRTTFTLEEGLVGGLALGLVGGIIFGLVFSLIAGLSLGLVLGLLGGLVVILATGIPKGLVFGLIACLGFTWMYGLILFLTFGALGATFVVGTWFILFLFVALIKGVSVLVGETRESASA